jgi:hypothetical protein
MVWPCGQDPRLKARSPSIESSRPLGSVDDKSLGKQSSGCRASRLVLRGLEPTARNPPRVAREDLP